MKRHMHNTTRDAIDGKGQTFYDIFVPITKSRSSFLYSNKDKV